MKESEIWCRFIDGDDTCFSFIYKKYVNILFRYGMQFTPNQELVKDAIHDIFVRVHHHRNELDRNVHVKFYLLKALKNCLYNMLNRNLAFQRADQVELLNIADNDAEKQMISSLEAMEQKEMISQLLNRLTNRQREAIYYRFIEELSMKEIGSLMNMNAQSTQNIIQRSLRKMREPNISPFNQPDLCIE